jgi:hypothetical protein
MNDQLAQLLKFLTDTLQQGKDFTIDQAPQFVRELLVWRFYEAMLYMIFFSLSFLVVGVGLERVIIDTMAVDDKDKRTVKVWIYPIMFLFIVFAIGINSFTMIQVKVAPRVVIVKMVRELLSNQR